MLRPTLTASVAVSMLLITLPASADYVITQQAAPAPTYSTTLNFDEVGGPTGNAALDAWSVSHGISVADTGVGGGVVVGDFSGALPWLPTNNAAAGAFGLFWTFESAMSEMSFQAWDPSGPPSPFGGGMAIVLLSGGAEVAVDIFTPSWGGVGDTWYNITTSGGMVFDEVRVLGFGFSPETVMDNMSWNVIPGPGGLMMLAFSGMIATRRRRA